MPVFNPGCYGIKVGSRTKFREALIRTYKLYIDQDREDEIEPEIDARPRF